MPEGDTVHKLAAYLSPLLTGRCLTLGRVRDRPDAELDGQLVTGVSAHGKHLFIHFDDGRILRTHLGMRGSWHHYRAGEAWQKPVRQAAVELHASGQVLVCFNPMQVQLDRNRSPTQRALASHLGPDLLATALDTERIVARARTLLGPDTPLVDVLLDQRVAAGIGNV